MTMTMIAPAPFFSVQAQSGQQYTADVQGIITGVAVLDVASLNGSGCLLVGVAPTGLLGRLLNANMNITTDQPIPMFIGPAVSFRITKISAKRASVSLTTAAGGIYSAASKGGTAIVAAGQAYSGLTSNTLALDLTVASTPGLTEWAAGVQPILSLTTGQGAAATADFYVYGDIYS